MISVTKELSVDLLLILLINISTDLLPIRTACWLIVVSWGSESIDVNLSPKPTIDKSFGISIFNFEAIFTAKIPEILSAAIIASKPGLVLINCFIELCALFL